MIETEEQARSYLGDMVPSGSLVKFEQLETLLAEENARQNLVSRGTLTEVWVRHFADSAQLVGLAPANPSNWLDLGTGAGFPGLIVALLSPDTSVVCVESRKLRCQWLERAATVLALTNVTIRNVRVEDMATQKFGVISARAFAPLDKLLSLSARFSTPDTYWVLPKGASAKQELAKSGNRAASMFHVEQSITSPDAGIIVGRLNGQRDRSG